MNTVEDTFEGVDEGNLDVDDSEVDTADDCVVDPVDDSVDVDTSVLDEVPLRVVERTVEDELNEEPMDWVDKDSCVFDEDSAERDDDVVDIKEELVEDIETELDIAVELELAAEVNNDVEEVEVNVDVEAVGVGEVGFEDTVVIVEAPDVATTPSTSRSLKCSDQPVLPPVRQHSPRAICQVKVQGQADAVTIVEIGTKSPGQRGGI
ncbi:hypothetical protein EV361DRAFT_984471 [Lentinula raphanica]|nr:hypothetical protein F5880DRAFT_1609433 [Lentinula raphanica]KAJ3972353.1 hypothetical protein EV361DRAFT_984471 [Lentinula raphanica]